MYLGTEVGGEERDRRPQDKPAKGQEGEPEPLPRVEPGGEEERVGRNRMGVRKQGG